MNQNIEKQDVRRYWESKPLGSLDLTNPGTREYFEGHDKLYEHEIPYAMHLFEFDRHAGELVLDVGCGPGWLVRNFARGGARIVAVDLTNTAVQLTRKSLRIYDLRAQLGVADAENLPFPDGTFDYATSNGVLHHTPDTQKAFREVLRVLKPGGRAMISVYYRHLLLSRALFPVTRLALRLLSLRAAGRSKLTTARTVDEFVNAYDGDGNPLGRVYNKPELRQLCEGFTIENVEVHFFPRRFFPFGDRIPEWMHRILDRSLGTLVYAQLRKPA
jgi:ubiquinone/menaquinone biosynthesis C-methylase UbiE